MTTKEYLMICLIEEGGEVIQRVSKALRFGFQEIQKGQPLDNTQRIVYELHDLMIILELLDKELKCDPILALHYAEKKKEKIKKYLAYSKELGIVKD